MLIVPVMFTRLCRARDRVLDVREPRSIATLARDCNLSPTQFIRHFQALFGDTPHQVRIRARIDRAKELLAHDRESVTDVCLEVGFQSLGSFSTTFARRVGANPTEYRRQLRPLIQVPGTWPPALTPGCLNLFVHAFRNFGEASRLAGTTS